MVASIAKATFGALEYDKETSDDDIDGIKIDIVDLFGLMQELSETIAQIDELSDVADKVIAEVNNKEMSISLIIRLMAQCSHGLM